MLSTLLKLASISPPSFVSGTSLFRARLARSLTSYARRTTIGYGSKDQGTHGVHGNPLKVDDTVAIKKKFGFDPEEFFAVPQATSSLYSEIAAKGAATEAAWNSMFASYGQKYPQEHADITRRLSGKLPTGWEAALPSFTPKDEAVASRKLSEALLAKISVAVPEFVSGSADLTPSNLTRWKNAVDFQPASNGLGDYTGRYMYVPSFPRR